MCGCEDMSLLSLHDYIMISMFNKLADKNILYYYTSDGNTVF